MRDFVVPGILGAVVGAVIVWFALLPHRPPPAPVPRTLTIGIYKTSATACEVDFPEAEVSLHRMEQVGWQSQDTDQGYTVIFQPSPATKCTDTGTPFNTGRIYVPPAPSTGTTPPVGNKPKPNSQGHYCYEVFMGNYTTDPPPASALCNDPGLHVKD